MRTRSQSNLPEEESPGGLAGKSREAVERILKRKGSRILKRKEECISNVVEGQEEGNQKSNVKSKIVMNGDHTEEPDWVDGSIFVSNNKTECSDNRGRGLNYVTVEFTESPSSEKRKVAKRASAEDKELAELVHKVHLLCLLARGRMIDEACDDPFLQASLVSLLPAHLSCIEDVPTLTAKTLGPIVNWFHGNFRVQSLQHREGTFKSNLVQALGTREGTSEEVAALSVALFRALNLTTRFVSILNVASLKPDVNKAGTSDQDGISMNSRVFSTPTKNAANPGCISPVTPCQASEEASNKDPQRIDQTNELVSEPQTDSNSISKRKSDIEFELQMEMALCASAAGARSSDLRSDSQDPCCNSSDGHMSNKMKKIKSEQSSDTFIRESYGAAWSRKNGSPLFWAEVFCTGEAMTGRWIHVDAVNATINGEEKVESAATACKKSLRYVVAFAGRGAKDVTRRYCMRWYTVAPHRINSGWWESVFKPLKELEKAVTDRQEGKTTKSCVPCEAHVRQDDGSENYNAARSSRSSLEDMELETRALTEPLPSNQQAYKNHNLYAMERWLTKYQIIYPKGPVLGYCSGHPIYPRTCVKNLQTRQRWLREGLQVKANECPVKVVKHSRKSITMQNNNSNLYGEDDSGGTLELYGRWQTEPLNLPHAVNGIVPKNERGQVDMWSEKCLPPGTVHLRYSRIVPVVKRLEVDFAPAMVGFEFRNGRSVPVFEGIVICTEFKDAVLEAYAEEEDRRDAEEKKRNEAQAISRWYQLLSSMMTRQRLKSSYQEKPIPQSHKFLNHKDEPCGLQAAGHGNVKMPPNDYEENLLDPKLGSQELFSGHEHIFPIENQSFDEETSVRTKRCACGFSISLEEL